MRRWTGMPRCSGAGELALFALALACLWIKLVLLSVGLDDEPFPTERHVQSATLAAVLLLGAPIVLLSRGRTIGALVLNGVVTTVALADAVHFRFFGDVISIPDLTRGPQVRGVVSSVLDALRAQDALLYLDLLVLTAVLVFIRARRGAPRPLPTGRRVRMACGLAFVGFLAAIPALIMIREDREEVFTYANARRQVVAAIGLLPYHLFDASVYAAYPLRGRLGTGDAERRRVRSFFETRWRTRPAPSPLSGVARGRNVIFVMAESLHDFPLGLQVGGRAVTPHLDAFAEESLRFVNFFDQTWMGATSDGEFASLQSLHPLPAGAVSTRFAANEFHGLPAVLGEHRYATFSSIGQPGDYWNVHQMHPALGFGLSRFYPRNLRDDEFFARTVPAIDSLPEPFFAFLITLTNHHPYRIIPARERELKLGELEGTLVGDYLHGVHAFDRAFGKLVRDMRTRGLLDTSVVVLYGDHQAWLGESPELAQLLDFPPDSELDHWLVTKKVPLLIRLPGGSHASKRATAGGHLDIAPTVLGLLGIVDQPPVMLGRDLTAGGPGLVVFRDGSFTDGTRHYVHRFGPDGASRAYDASARRRIDAGPLQPAAERAAEQLLVSDLVLAGNLVPWLRELASPGRVDNQGATPPRRFEVIGHRGDPEHAPENTLASIDAAFDAGATMVEVDVQLTRDGVPVLLHDLTLDRTTDGSGSVGRLTLAEAKRLDAGSWYGPQFAGERIPTLEEALKAARRRGRLLLDPKMDGMGRAVAETLNKAGLGSHAVVLGSWRKSQADDFALNLPGAQLLMSGGKPGDWQHPRYFGVLRHRGIRGFEFGAPPSADFIAAAHAHDMPVYVYTVNDPDSMTALLDLGIDAIETDVPAVLAKLVEARGGPLLASKMRYGDSVPRPSAAGPVSKPYLLAKDARGEILVSPAGDSIRVTPTSFQGFLDDGGTRYGMVYLIGWAADVSGGRPADSLLVFVDGKFIGPGTTGSDRPDLVKAFGKSELTRAGFRLFLPPRPFQESPKPRVRVFALTGAGQASELRYGEKFPWAPR